MLRRVIRIILGLVGVSVGMGLAWTAVPSWLTGVSSLWISGYRYLYLIPASYLDYYSLSFRTD